MATALDKPPAVVDSSSATARPKSGFRKYWHLYAAISPFYLLFLCFGLIPVGFSFYLSLHRWDGLGSMEWAGLCKEQPMASSKCSDTFGVDNRGNMRLCTEHRRLVISVHPFSSVYRLTAVATQVPASVDVGHLEYPSRGCCWASDRVELCAIWIL